MDTAGKIVAISNWIDDSYPSDLGGEVHLRRRINKITEENGEVHEALGGMVGENPRKGVTHTRADVEYELLDVAVAALGALAHMTGENPIVRLREHVDMVWERAGLSE